MHIVQVEYLRNVQIYLSILWQSMVFLSIQASTHTKSEEKKKKKKKHCNECFSQHPKQFYRSNTMCFVCFLSCSLFRCFWSEPKPTHKHRVRKNTVMWFSCVVATHKFFFLLSCPSLARIQMCHLVDFIGELKLFVCVWMKRLNVCFTLVEIIVDVFLVVDDDVWYKILCQQTCCFPLNVVVIVAFAVAGESTANKLGVCVCVCKRSKSRK